MRALSGMAEKLVHPTRFERVASAFGGQGSIHSTPTQRPFHASFARNMTGFDGGSPNITRTNPNALLAPISRIFRILHKIGVMMGVKFGCAGDRLPEPTGDLP